MLQQYHKVEIKLNRASIMYDVDNIAFITGDLMPTNDEKMRSGVQDVSIEGNSDRIIRVLNKVFNELVYKLTAYTKEDTLNDCIIDNLFSEPKEYILVLNVPNTFSKPNAKAVCTASHEYMTYIALSEWFSITKPDEAIKYMEKGETELMKVKNYLTTRTKKIRRKLSTF